MSAKPHPQPRLTAKVLAVREMDPAKLAAKIPRSKIITERRKEAEAMLRAGQTIRDERAAFGDRALNVATSYAEIGREIVAERPGGLRLPGAPGAPGAEPARRAGRPGWTDAAFWAHWEQAVAKAGERPTIPAIAANFVALDGSEGIDPDHLRRLRKSHYPTTSRR